MNLKSYFINRLSAIHRGFTLIELLVVIAIVGILVALISANFITAQKQARDAKRQQHMESVQTSFETYYIINDSAYPATSGEIDSAFEGGTRPVDPQPAQSYTWNSDASAYCVCADLEAKTGNADAPSGTSCNWNTSGTSFCVQNKQ